MKLRLLATLLLTLVAVPALVQAEEAPPAPAHPAGPKKEKTPLEKEMSKIGKAMRALKKQISDPAQNASSLQQVAIIHGAATASLDLVPAKAAGLTGADKDKFVASYRDAMKEFIAAVDQLSAALTAGNNGEAAKLYQTLPDLMKKDHKEFRKPAPKKA